MIPTFIVLGVVLGSSTPRLLPIPLAAAILALATAVWGLFVGGAWGAIVAGGNGAVGAATAWVAINIGMKLVHRAKS